MRKNLHDKILKIESKKQHLSTIPKSSPKKISIIFWGKQTHKKKKKKKKKGNHGQIDNLKFP